jgi:F-type H+-transporting ATPase subunit gamma
MPSLKAIRKRIASVRNTQQITKAMKMVSAAKLRRAQEAVIASRPYSQKLAELLGNLAAEMPEETHPMLRRSEGTQRIELLVVTADRGLCGAYNTNIVRQAEKFLRDHGGSLLGLAIVGRKGVEYFRRRGTPITDRWVQTGTPSVGLVREIAATLTARFTTGEVDRIDVLYSRFRSALSQVPTFETLLPVTIEDRERAGEPRDEVEYLVEPDPIAVLDRLLPRYVEARLHHALLEAQASEQGARMTAMDSATSNAADMIFRLTLEMNRARQAAITKELMEIVSGAEALKG